jgi:hypothetical protein
LGAPRRHHSHAPQGVLGGTSTRSPTCTPRTFSPTENQTANAWKFDYRVYHDLFVPDNKAAGIYAHSVTEIS